MSICCSKHVEAWDEYIEKECVKLVINLKNYVEMHGQQNIKYCMFCLKCTGRRKCVPLQDNRLGRVTVCIAPFIPKLGKQRQWPASHYTSFTLDKTIKSTLWIANWAGTRTNPHRPPFLPSGSWLSIMTTGQSNIGMRLHGYWVIWYCTNFKAAGNTLMNQMEFLWRAGCKTQSGRKYFQTLLRPFRQGFLTLQDNTTIFENLRETVQGNIGETWAANVLETTTHWGGRGIGQGLHRTKSDTLIRNGVYNWIVWVHVNEMSLWPTSYWEEYCNSYVVTSPCCVKKTPEALK